MSTYTAIAAARKKALKAGDDDKAQKIFDAMKKLVKDGKTTEEERRGASYL